MAYFHAAILVIEIQNRGLNYPFIRHYNSPIQGKELTINTQESLNR